MYATKMKSKLKTDARKIANRTGFPVQMKYGIENISGCRMDDVRVHYNSPKPAQLQSLAYTPGKITPAEQMKGININSNHSYPAINLKNTSAVPCVQRQKDDIFCTAKITYKEGSPSEVGGEGYNNTEDKEKVIETFKSYGLKELAEVKQIPGSNPPGQCAEPHAVSNALKKPPREITGIQISQAQFTQTFKDRIIPKIRGNTLKYDSNKDDRDLVNAMLANNQKHDTVEQINDGDQEKINDLISFIKNSELIRSRCQTCKQWIYKTGAVKKSYLKSEETVEQEEKARKVAASTRYINDFLNPQNRANTGIREKKMEQLKEAAKTILNFLNDYKNGMEINSNMHITMLSAAISIHNFLNISKPQEDNKNNVKEDNKYAIEKNAKHGAKTGNEHKKAAVSEIKQAEDVKEILAETDEIIDFIMKDDILQPTLKYSNPKK